MQDARPHNDSVRKVAMSPNDMKFVTASDDSTLKVTLSLSICKAHNAAQISIDTFAAVALFL